MADSLVMEVKSEAALADKAGQHLTFALGKEVYGIEILRVQEIIGLMEITRVPQTPHYIRGVINLRGKMIPVMELRKRFALETVEDTERTCIIVVEINMHNTSVTIGLLADEVREVTQISADQLAPAPSMGSAVDSAFILGMAKLDDKVVMLLDVDKIMGSSKLQGII